MKQKLLCWFPVVLLPTVNIIIAITYQAACELENALPFVIGAIAEELVFRWFLLKKLLFPRLKPTVAVILVAIGFACMHLFNLRSGTDISLIVLQILLAFCFSIWAGFVTYRSSFLIPLLAHVLLNLTATIDIGWVTIAVSTMVLFDGILLMKSVKE